MSRAPRPSREGGWAGAARRRSHGRLLVWHLIRRGRLLAVGDPAMVDRFLELPIPDLFEELARAYVENLQRELQRSHPEAAEPLARPGIRVHPPPGRSSEGNAPESPAEREAHGRRIWSAMMEPVAEEVCRDQAAHPEVYDDPHAAVHRLTSHWTRVDPPDPLFLLAACLAWKQGIRQFCEEFLSRDESGEGAGRPEEPGGRGPA